MRKIMDQFYIILVNQVPGIKEKYEKKRRQVKGYRKIEAWLYLLYMDIAYYVFRYKKLGELSKYPIYEAKQLYSEGSESSLSKRASPQEFASQLEKYDIISFDVFDTLVFRPFSEPTDLFFVLENQLGYMDFKRIRSEMEWKAREKKYKQEKHYEVNLEEIYDVLSKETGIPKEQAMDKEVALELEFCYANPYMFQVVQELRRKKKKMIVTSDMYLNTRQIQTLLRQCGYEPFDAYYVSCDVGKSKNQGDLFEHIKGKQGTSLSYVHVGDNEYSDVMQAKKHGFESVHYPNVNQTGMRYRAEDMSVITGGIYRGLVNAHLHNGLEVYSREYEYGYVYGGLFVTGYCQMIHKYVQEHEVDKILFLARDGDILKKAYEKMYPEEIQNCEYVYWSRLAATKMGARYFKYDYFRRFLYHKVNQNYTIKEIIASMELEHLLSELCESTKLTVETKLTDRNVDKVKAYLLDRWKAVLQQYEEQLEAGRQYYQEKLQGARNAVAVDIGWAGSGAIVLDYIVNHIWHMDCSITGIIAGTNTCHNAEPDATETFLQSGKLVSYLYSQRENRDLWKYHNPGKLHNLYWEMLLDAPMGSFIGFYLDERNQNICKFKDINTDISRIEEIHKGILKFVEQYKNLKKKLNLFHEISGRDAYAPMLLVQGDVNHRFMNQISEIMDEMGVM